MLSQRKSIFLLPISLVFAFMLVGCIAADGSDAATNGYDPVIEVKPNSALMDQPVQIVLSNFNPGENVTIQARMRYTSNEVWESWATFSVDQNGQIEVGSQIPLTGTYHDIDGMGLFWSMEERRDIDASFSRAPLDPINIEFIAKNDDATLAIAQIERLLVDPKVVRQPVRENGLIGTLFLPSADETEYPVIIVLSESVDSIGESKAALFASHGYATLALYYFRGTPHPGDLLNVSVEYFGDAIAWLQAHDSIDGEKIGIVGASRGGELALLLGSFYSDIKAVVAYVPSGVVFQGIDSKSWESQPAWLYKGAPIPYIPFAFGDFQIHITEQTLNVAPIAYAHLYRDSYHKVDAIDDVTIPVENIQGPVLLISGRDDQMWPSALLSELVIERLRNRNHPYSYQHLSYDGAGHGIFPPYWPTTKNQYYQLSTGQLITIGGNARDDAFACVDSWDSVLEFFDSNLMDKQ